VNENSERDSITLIARKLSEIDGLSGLIAI